MSLPRLTTHLTTRLTTRLPPSSILTRPQNRSLNHTTPNSKQHQSPPRLTLPDHEIKHVFILGGGSGGQVINKTSSAAQLTHLPTGIVVKSQATRSQSQNYKIARRILADKVDERLNGEKSRVIVKREKEAGRKRSGEKKRRRKYRALEEAKGEGREEGGVNEREATVVMHGEEAVGEGGQGALRG